MHASAGHSKLASFEGRPLKIAFIEKDLSPRSGSRRFIYEVTNYLNARKHKTRCFTLKLDEKKCFPEFLSIPVEVVPIEEFRSLAGRVLKRTLRRDIDYLWLENRAILEMGRRLADWDPDIAIFHYAGEVWLQPYFYYLKEPVGAVCLHVVPPVMSPHALPFQRLKWHYRVMGKVSNLPPIKNWNTASLKKVGLIIAHSRYLFDQAVKQDTIGSRKTAIVPLGVNHSEFYPTGEEEPFALYLGRIHPDKSLELAVRAMKETGPDKSLIIAGDLESSYLWYKEKLENIAKRIGISDRFKMILSPTTDQVVRLMQKCSIFLFPSLVDTFGLVTLEAMACGKPVVACNKGGVPELLDDCGFLLDPDVRQWQKTVKNLSSNPDLRRETGRKAFEKSKLYSWQNTADSLLHVLENFLASTRTSNHARAN